MAMEKGQAGGIYHFSPDEGGMKVIDIVKTVCKIMGRDFRKSVRTVPDRIGQDAAYIIDSAKTRHELKWQPKIELEEGIRQVVSWVEENWAEIKNEPLTYSHKF